MSIIVSRTDVSFLEYENQYVGHLEEIIPRNQFYYQFDIDLRGIETLAYEPDRGMYHVETKDGVVAVKDPNDHTMLATIHARAAEIQDFFEDFALQKTRPSQYHELINKVWIITPENQAILDREIFETNFRAERDKLLAEADILIYKAEDAGQDTTALREYRQALRDATNDWIMPEAPVSA
jgi:hypothetical protein